MSIRSIGILHCGDMGLALGRALREHGFDVATTFENRSGRMAEPTRAAGIAVLRSLDDVIAASDLLISLVPPAAAMDVARRCCDAPRARAGRIYVDANSIAPATANRIAARTKEAGFAFVDAAIYGLASHLRTTGKIFLSGERAPDLYDVFSGFTKVSCLGAQPGRASAMKMLIAGLNKGLVALFFELAQAADDLSLLPQLIEEYDEHYPGIMTVIRRLVPTYPAHVQRREEEMAELQAMLQSLGADCRLINAVRATFAALAAVEFPRQEWTVDAVLERIGDSRRARADV